MNGVDNNKAAGVNPLAYFSSPPILKKNHSRNRFGGAFYKTSLPLSQ